jgi:ectoine hydroxylase-related dioxygenase (phytanoyl-CoA dioxygenase family)
MLIIGKEKNMNNVAEPTIQADRDPRRLSLPGADWKALTAEQKEEFFEQADREIHEIGILVVANVLTEQQCDEFVEIIRKEIRTATRMERALYEKQGPTKGYKVRNFQQRHPAALELITHPLVVEYFRRYLGPKMVLHSSEGVIIPPGTEDGPIHRDGYDLIPDYFLSMNSIYYLCDTTEENGATRYAPGTHKELFANNEEVRQRKFKYAEVKKGDLVLFNPYLVHASSANRSNAERPVIINYYQRGYIKQEFDYTRMLSVVEAKKLTKGQRILLGYEQRMPHDIDELYLIGSSKAALADFDPAGYDN